ncbi:SAP domain-containing protein [Coccidioides immitis RS]|uniref:SAP domain-containing protein n=3 Tax=Coccidioides immitis TaxID=5501 RepID=J3K7C5_COCIM|nr:SAP domain-containing protein [Coccidioides immitis RS]EAS30590.3 SAP domain-containing protein [Coccidioides immitis RS]KMP03142.1 SAP domain containing protein [Coccidioides immitis RMSCC 2394]KMU79217.1 SAP domain containing protein [Coccidioides immitis RMSCC 3703]
MADYNSWKVADLKAELKRRGIPQTRLRLKQQIIDRLLESDASGQNENVAEKVASEGVPEAENEVTVTSSPKEATKQKEPSPEQTRPAAEPVPSDSGDAACAPIPEPSQPPQEEPQEQPQDVTMGEVAPPLNDQPDLEPASREPVAVKDREEVSGLEKEPAKLPEPPETESTQPSDERPSQAPSTEKDIQKEEIDDSKKRKRRSQSPPPSPRSAAQKRARAEDGHPRVILQEDLSSVEKNESPDELITATQRPAAPEAMEIDTLETHRETSTKEDATKVDDLQAQPKIGQESRESPKPEPPKDDSHSVPEDSSTKEDDEESKKAERKEEPVPQEHGPLQKQDEEIAATKKPAGDARFKGLFSANGLPGRRESPPPAEDEERVVAPALHPATTSLYIRDFMRPLQPANLKRHLAALATPPDSTPNPDIILDFFLDSIKTHCFVTFANVAAASRVRTALHATIWPEERTRKPLWVDFVPEEKVKEWIEIEQAGNNRRDAHRWEVIYEDREDGTIAVLQEAVSNTARNRNQSFNLGREPPTGPRAERPFGRGSLQAGPPSNLPASGFKALDDRFLSTSAKPKLYYLPVSREASDKRLDKFDDLARAGPTRRPGGDEMRRFTFEDDDFFVDQGPEYGSRRGRAPRGRGGGAFAEWGGSWRGRRCCNLESSVVA